MAVALAYTPLITDTALKAYYKLEDTSDSSGNANTLTNNNTVAFNAALFGNGGDCGASNTNKYLSVGNLGIAATSPLSISFWIKLRTEVAASQYDLAVHASQITSDRYMVISYQFNGGTRRIILDPSGGGTSITYTITLGTTNWYHIVGTRDGTNNKLYVNGVLQGTQANGTGAGGANVFNIGSNQSVNPSSAIFDDVAVFSKTLTQAEVTMLYQGPQSYLGKYQ